MPSYRKNPVVIEAFELTAVSRARHDTWPAWAQEAWATGVLRPHPGDPQSEHASPLIIHTLEGDMEAMIGDFLIRGVKGEIYPCKPDIFALTYSEETAPASQDPAAKPARFRLVVPENPVGTTVYDGAGNDVTAAMGICRIEVLVEPRKRPLVKLETYSDVEIVNGDLIVTRREAFEDFKLGRAGTGVSDSKGKEIRVGDLVRREVTGNKEIHGEWSLTRVKLQGLTPILSYERSERGQVLPVGYTAGTLADCYDQKMFVFATNPRSLRPCDGHLFVVPEDYAGAEIEYDEDTDYPTEQ